MIKKYIEFAIKNEYKPIGYEGSHKNEIEIEIKGEIELEGELSKGHNFTNTVNGLFVYDIYHNIYRPLEGLIQSKPFIEAIARGTLKATNCNIEIFLEKEIEHLTNKQATAIREDELDEYITKLLKG